MSSRNTHSKRSSLANTCGRRRSRFAGSSRARSICRISVWRSGMRGVLAEQAVVHTQVQPRLAQLRNALVGWWPRQIAYDVEGWDDVLFEQQPERCFDLTLGRAGRQMQQPHVVPIGTFRGVALECVVGTAEGQAGKEIVAVAIVSERAGLAHQRPDDVAVIDGMLTGPEQPRHAQEMRG